MNETKPWYTSKTIWGSLVAFGAGIATFFGLEIEPQTQTLFTDTILQIVAVLASLFAIFGRLSATSAIE